jgi:hypothetical protein
MRMDQRNPLEQKLLTKSAIVALEVLLMPSIKCKI